MKFNTALFSKGIAALISVVSLNIFAQSNSNGVYTNMVPVDSFYIDIFEMNCERQNALKSGSCTWSTYWKPARLNGELAKELCLLDGKRIPTVKEWLLAARNMGTNKMYTLAGDKIQSSTGSILTHSLGAKKSDESIDVTDFVLLGIDGIGTVGMTGNREEVVEDPDTGGFKFCGGSYKIGPLQIKDICRDQGSDDPTVRCVVNAKDVVKVEFTPAVKGGLLDYIRNLPKSPSLSRIETEDRFIGRNPYTQDPNMSDNVRLSPLGPYYLENY